MSQLAPDDRPLYERLRELGSLGEAALSVEPEELWFFRVDDRGRPTALGDPSLLIIRDSSEPQSARVKSLLERSGDPGPVRVIWLTPDEIEKPSNAAFVREVRERGEQLAGLDVNPGGE